MSQHPRTRRKKNPTVQLVTSSHNLNPLTSVLPNLKTDFSNVSQDLTATSQDTNTSQLPPPPQLASLNLNPASGISAVSDDEDKPKRADRFAKMHDDLVENLCGLGMIVSTLNQNDGLIIIGRADPLATKIVALAKQNPAVYKALKRMLEGSVYSALALEVGAIANAIMANHGFNAMEKAGSLFKRKDQNAAA